MGEKNMKILTEKEQQEAEEMMHILNMLQQDQKKELFVFIQGIHFVKNLTDSEVITTA